MVPIDGSLEYIIMKRGNKSKKKDDYIFPILKKGLTPQQEYDHIKTFIRNTNKRLAVGYNTISDVAAIQSIDFGVGLKELLINPAGGNVGIGMTGTPSYTLDVNGGGHYTGNLTVDGTITGTLNFVPAGCIMMWSTTSAPTGWLLCDGNTFSSIDYPALANLLQDTYGIHSGTNYYKPNMCGRVPVGRDAAQTEFDTLGETGGAKTHTLSVAEMPEHTHGYSKPTAKVYSYDDVGSREYYTDGQTGSTTDSKGNGNAHNNLQPYLVLNYIIKV
jgi:microcystin-dependent protein